MEQIKIIFFDIDGTLIDMNSRCVSPKTIETLRRQKQRGIRICLATGRSPVELPRFDDIEIDVYLTYNGSLCYTKQEIVFSNPIPTGDVRKLIQNAAAMGKPVSVATKDRLAANGWDADLAEYYSIGHQVLTVAEDFDEICQAEIYQIMTACREQEYEMLLRGTQGVKIAAWWDRAADIIPASGGKGRGIREVLTYYGLNAADAMAFGDGNNDIEMFEAVGTGIAMGNASHKLKTVASEVCGDAAQDGVYHYCMEHSLI